MSRNDRERRICSQKFWSSRLLVKIDLACYEDIAGMVVGRGTLRFMLPMLQRKRLCTGHMDILCLAVPREKQASQSGMMGC